MQAFFGGSASSFAHCPEGSSGIGGGFILRDPANALALPAPVFGLTSVPTDSGWVARVVAPFDGFASITAYAVCATLTED